MSQSQENFWTVGKKDGRTKAWTVNSQDPSGHPWGSNNNNNNNNDNNNNNNNKKASSL